MYNNLFESLVLSAGFYPELLNSTLQDSCKYFVAVRQTANGFYSS